jgi:hypothetical protein
MRAIVVMLARNVSVFVVLRQASAGTAAGSFHKSWAKVLIPGKDVESRLLTGNCPPIV